MASGFLSLFCLLLPSVLIHNFGLQFWIALQFASTTLVPFSLQIGPFQRIMQCQSRFAKPITIAILILLSVLALVSLGEGLRLLVISRDGIKLKKRDGSTITFDLAWK
jgi:hypothetical protein